MNSSAHDASRIIGSIYDAALGSEDWHEILCQIADWCGVENAAMVTLDPRISYSSVITPRADPAVVNAYNSQWWEHDPTAVATANLAPGKITSLAFTGLSNFYSSAFYNDFWRTSGLGAERLATNLFSEDGAFSSFVLQASAANDTVEGDTRQQFQVLLPHLMRAVDIGRRMHASDLQAQNEQLAPSPDAPSRAIVDASGRVLFADATAELMFASHPSLTQNNGILFLKDPMRDRALKTAIRLGAGYAKQGLAASTIAVDSTMDGSRLQISVLPWRSNVANPVGPPAAAMLILTDPTAGERRRIDALRSTYGLTEAEAALAIEIAKGDGREAAASRLGISVNTARTHLMRIFEKTGVNRQAELARKIFEAQ